MTADEWEQERRRLVRSITQARKTAREAGSLADKLAARRVMAEREEALRLHKLNYRVLVARS